MISLVEEAKAIVAEPMALAAQMSRSRKKPSYSDYSRNYTRWAKRQASKAVRKYQGELSNGKMYKKVFQSWDIFDYKGLCAPDNDYYYLSMRK